MQRVSLAKVFLGSALLSSVAIPAAIAQGGEFNDTVFPAKRAHNCPIWFDKSEGLRSARCFSYIGTDINDKVVAMQAPSGFGPTDLRSAYNITTTGSSSTTIAIVDAYGYPRAAIDLAIYRKQFGLPPCTTKNGCFTKVDQNGGTNYPQFNGGWADETALDLQMASAMCPSCKILLVEGSSNSYQDLATAENTAAALGANVISNSYGGGESTQTSIYESAYNHPGIAITVSSGDGGYSAGTQFPASSPHVTSVGGTSLVRDSSARGWHETAWVDAGSGCSSIYPKPTWQTDTGCSNRMVADVSAVADPATGVAVYGPVSSRKSAWLVFGGTSVAAPLIAGIYGLNGGSSNYGSDPYAHPEALYDVTSGSNGTCSPLYFCRAIPGYDGPTGLGTPNGTAAF
jgi:subtilase family serine protease